jgi:hypothetical protein
MNFNEAKRILLKALPVGTIREHKDGNYKKISNDEWVKINEEKNNEKKKSPFAEIHDKYLDWKQKEKEHLDMLNQFKNLGYG